jgi:predicted O-methyltransferase YrrM
VANPPNPLRRAYRWAHRGALRALEAAGLSVARTADYYSPLPAVRELARTRERWDRPSALAGVSYDLDAMKALLARVVAEHGAELAELPPYDEAKRLGYGPGFTRVDATLLYLALRHLKPARLIEVGSGLSTYYASRASERNGAEGAPCAITCIDPYSGDRVRGLPGVEVLRRPVQDVPPDYFAALGPGDVLFIDSTHVVRIDGDVPHLYLEVVPRLRPGVVVHSHDVHLPYNVPHPAEEYVFGAKWPMLWTEAMLLQAFLAFNAEFELLLAPPLIRHHDEPFLAATVPDYRPVVAADYDTHFGSVWYRRRENA